MNSDIQVLIPLFVALPLAVSLLIQLVARGRPVRAEWLANATMLALVLMTCYAIGRSGLYHMGGWPTPIGIDLRLDALANLLLLAVSLVGFAVALYSVDYMRRFTARGHFYSLFLLMVTGMNGVILAGDLFNLYVFLEVAAVASYSLVAFGCAHEELEASFKYIVLGSAWTHRCCWPSACSFAGFPSRPPWCHSMRGFRMRIPPHRRRSPPCCPVC